MKRWIGLLFALALAAPARAQVDLALEFDTAELPSVSHGALFEAADEASLASVAGGALSFSTRAPNANQGFWRIDDPVDLAGDLHVVLRIRVDGMDGGSHGGFGVLVGDGAAECNLLFRPDGVAIGVVSGLFDTGSFHAFDHSGFHVYELTCAGGGSSCDLSIDGVARTSAPRPQATAPDLRIAFGDLVNSVSDAAVTIDFLRITVPEPGHAGTAIAAMAAFTWVARRRA